MRFSYDLMLHEVDLQKIFYSYPDTMKFKTETVIFKEIKLYSFKHKQRAH